jgi:hypothetical protein
MTTYSLLFYALLSYVCKLDRDDPWEEDIQISSNEVDPPWEGTIRGPKRGIFRVLKMCR